MPESHTYTVPGLSQVNGEQRIAAAVIAVADSGQTSDGQTRRSLSPSYGNSDQRLLIVTMGLHNERLMSMNRSSLRSKKA